MHQQTAMMLGQNDSVTIRGDGGEAEIRPDADCSLQWVRQGEYIDQTWPKALTQRQVRSEKLELRQLLNVWRGESHVYGEAAAIETLAVCLRLMGWQATDDLAREQAYDLWQQRNKEAY